MNQKHHIAGYAMVIVMLFTLLTLVTVTITVASASGGNRTTVTRGQQADRALMIANSGQSGFLGSIRENNFRGELYDLQCFVEGGNCNGVTKPGLSRTFVMNPSDPNSPRSTWTWAVDYVASTFQVTSTGLLNASSSQKAVATQTYDFISPPSLNVSVPAALVSCDKITTGGNSKLSGNADPTGVIPLTSIVSSSPSSFSAGTTTWPTNTITVANGSAIKRGAYVSIGGSVFKVSSKTSANTFSIEPPNLADRTTWPNASKSIPLSGGLGLVPMASTQKVTSVDGTNFLIPMSDVSGLQRLDTLYVTIGGIRYGLTVVGVDSSDLANPKAIVTLGATGPGANRYDPNTGAVLQYNAIPAPTADQMLNLTWGTPVARYVMGATSKGSIGSTGGTDSVVPNNVWSGASQVTPAAIAGRSTMACGNSGELFSQTFNMTKDDYLALDPVMLTALNGPLKPNLYWLGPKTYPNSATYKFGSNDLCGSGILIINGNLSMQGTGSVNGTNCASQPGPGQATGFTGIIYVMGQYDNTGNSVIHGALVVEGRYGGTTALGGGMEIDYNEASIMAGAGRLTVPVIKARPGTWRQK